MSNRLTTMEATSITSGRDPRSDVLYHFYAYHYFAPTAIAIDLTNLTDADVNFYNLVADIIRGSNSNYRLAVYLKTYHHCVSSLQAHPEMPTTTAPEIGHTDDEIFRKEFIFHVKTYNETVKPRNRFYIIGLTPSDMEYVLSFYKNDGEETHPIRMATDACCDLLVPYLCRQSFEGARTSEGTMDTTLKKCLVDSGDKLKADEILGAKLEEIDLAVADNINKH